MKPYGNTLFGINASSSALSVPSVLYDLTNKAILTGYYTPTSYDNNLVGQNVSSSFNALGCLNTVNLTTNYGSLLYVILKIPNTSYSTSPFGFSNNTGYNPWYTYNGSQTLYLDALSNARLTVTTKFTVPNTYSFTNSHICKIYQSTNSVFKYSYITGSPSKCYSSTYTGTTTTSIGGLITPLLIGAGGNTGGNFGCGNGAIIYQVLLFNELLTTQDCSNIEAHLINKFGL
jgi:hypothetical protein